ncbi:MAG: hypothetical protein AAF465_05260 [Pseudomonadota bacterium]
MILTRRLGQRIGLLTLLALMSACTTTQQRLGNAEAFATAGIGYTEALPAVLDESFRLSVRQNSLQLLNARADLSEEQRERRLALFDEVLRERATLLGNLQRHANVLKNYFAALRALASSDNATGITSEANSVIDQLAQLRPRIENASVGGATVGEAIEQTTSIAVGAFQNAALKNEIDARRNVIDTELALQETAIALLVEDMIDNAQQILLMEETNPIVIDFATGNSVNKDWSERRLAQFSRSIELESYADIRTAAGNLRRTWRAFAAQSNADPAIAVLIQDIQNLIALTNRFKDDD